MGLGLSLSFLSSLVSKVINVSNLLSVGAYAESYHMILRDLQGDNITKDIRDWILGRKNIEENENFKDVLKIFENTEFYHRLD